jgi:hypothetical protein
MMSSATPSGPSARPCASLDSARLIASASAPCWTAKLNAIALSRALVSAALFVPRLFGSRSRVLEEVILHDLS